MKVRAQSNNGLVTGYLMNHTQINTSGGFDIWINPITIDPETIKYQIGDEWLSKDEIFERVQTRLRSPKVNDTKGWSDYQNSGIFNKI